MAHIGHRILFAAEVEGPLPGGIVSMEEKRPDIGLQRVQSRLKDVVGEALAHVHPLAAGDRVAMGQVALQMDHLVVRAVAIDDATFVTGYPAGKAGPVELVTKT